MNALPLAFSLSSSVTEVGAIAAFAALLGIAILSLLVFSQAREIKRLREWAGRAPERAVEMEQRVSADAAARVQRSPGSTVAARVVPRKTPLVSAPVSTAVHATATAAVPGLGVAPAGPVPPMPGAESIPQANAQTPAPASAGAVTPAAGADAEPPGEGSPESVGGGVSSTDGVSSGVDSGEGAGEHSESAPGTANVEGVVASAPSAMAAQAAAPLVLGAAGRAAATQESGEGERESSLAESSAPAPATAAARATGTSPRAPLPPSPAAPAPPGSSTPSAAGSPKTASRPPAPVASARRIPSRALPASGSGGSGETPRSPMPRALSSSASAGRATSAPLERAPLAPAGSGGPKYFKPERSTGRATILIVGGVIVVALLLVLATSVFKGGGSPAPTTQAPATGEAPVVSSHTGTPAKASNPADTSVVVLNGTSTQGLAHHLAADLQQSGYTLAAAASAVPPGTHPSTVIEYARGHRADAQAVAKTLNVTQVQAAEAATASLAGAANVIVLAGADQAALLGGGGAQSKGEPVGSVESGETAAAGPVAVGRMAMATVTTGADEARAVAMGAGATEGAAGAGQ